MPTRAQTGPELQNLLPAGAAVIESVRLNVRSGRPRALVLWMSSRKRLVRPREDGYCGDNVYGDYWSGPTRLSLVDSRRKTLINTVEVRSGPDGPEESMGQFRIPYLVPAIYYHVARPNRKKEGVPRILFLRDLTGEGDRGQFVLFDYLACGIVSTGVFGYSSKADRATQFQVETITNRHRPELTMWVPVVFERKPVRPGRWRFTWEAGHGDMFRNHEAVTFDRERQLFVRRLKREAYSDYGEASRDLTARQFARLLEVFKARFGPGIPDSTLQELRRTAENLPPDDKRLDIPISVSDQGRKIELDIALKKYKDGDLGMWIVTERTLAAQLQKLMDEVLR